MTISQTPRSTSPRGHAGQGDQRSLRRVLITHPGWSVAAVLLIAFNLRPAITSVAPFLNDIRRDTGLAGFAISLLTMAPVVCLGLFAPLAPPLARRFGPEAVILASLLGIVLGVVLRGFGTIALFAGTIEIGACMAVLGVLSPVIVKRDFPHRTGLMMGLYTMFISLGASVSTASGVPLMHALNDSWETALLFWALPALLGAIAFVPQLFRYADARGVGTPHVRGLLNDPLAWQVTGYLALVAALAYAVFTWGPAMLQARGLDTATSGLLLSISYVAQMVTGLSAPILAARQRDQRLLAVALVLLTAAGLMGVIFAPVWSLTGFSIVLGLGQGGSFALALSLIVLRAGDQHVAGQLSSLAQTVGYVVGGLVGPFAVGIIHDWSQSWSAVAVFYAIVAVLTMLFGLGAGRARTVAATTLHRRRGTAAPMPSPEKEI